MAGAGEQDVGGPKRNEALEAESIDPEDLRKMANRIKKCPLSTTEHLFNWMNEGSREREDGGGHGGGSSEMRGICLGVPSGSRADASSA